MKLIYCPDCFDVVKFKFNMSTCECGASWGYYEEDGLNAKYGGKCIPLGISNASLHSAITNDLFDKRVNEEHRAIHPKMSGFRFEAFVIPDVAPTIEFIKK